MIKIWNNFFKNPIYQGSFSLLISDPIDKFSLLNLIKRIYSLDITILEEYDNVIDRSLDSTKFRSETGFMPHNWEYLIQSMYDNNL